MGTGWRLLVELLPPSFAFQELWQARKRTVLLMLFEQAEPWLRSGTLREEEEDQGGEYQSWHFTAFDNAYPAKVYHRAGRHASSLDSCLARKEQHKDSCTY